MSEVQKKVLAQEPNPGLRVYLLWVPMFRGMERDVPTASREMPDARVAHYWDGESVTVKGYRETLALSEDAWDIFLIYPPGATWDSEVPPMPAFWMHQLGTARRPRVAGPYLNAEIFRDKLREISAAAAAPRASTGLHQIR